jgi:hypothetical protein
MELRLGALWFEPPPAGGGGARSSRGAEAARECRWHAEAGAAACLHGAVVPGLALAHLRGWAPCSRRTAGSPALTTPAPTARGPGGRVWQHEARTEGRY